MGCRIRRWGVGTGMAAAILLAAGPLPAQTSSAANGNPVVELPGLPQDADVFLNGSLKGQGLTRVEVLLPGGYTVLVRRAGFRPWSKTVSLALGQTVQVQPEFVPLRLAIFPLRRTGGWPAAENEAHTAGWVTGAIADAARRAKFNVSHTVHVNRGPNRFFAGEDLGKSPDVLQKSRGLTGTPNVDFARKKGTELDVDAVVYFNITTTSATSGNWQVQIVDPHSRSTVEDSGTWPYGPGGGPAVTRSLIPVFERFIKRLGQATGLHTVVVLPLEAENADPGAAVAIGESLREELRKTERFTVMDDSEVATILDRLAPQRPICTAVECALEMGRLLGAQMAVAGRVTGLSPTSWRVHVIQVNTATGETVMSDSVKHSGDLKRAGRALAPIAEDLAVTASPNAQEFRSSQSSWRWKTGLALGSATILALGGAYLVAELNASNDRQKDYRLQATNASTQGNRLEYDKWAKKLKDEQSAGKDLRNQAIGAEVLAVGLAVAAFAIYVSPPELAPTAFNIEPTLPDGGGIGVALSYRW